MSRKRGWQLVPQAGVELVHELADPIRAGKEREHLLS